MNYITYHEWSKHLRDATRIDQSAGKLQRVSAQSGIPLDRLERWLQKQISLSHAEFISLHEVLSETHVLNGSSQDATDVEESRSQSNTRKPQQRGCSTCEDNSAPFDESD